MVGWAGPAGGAELRQRVAGRIARVVGLLPGPRSALGISCALFLLTLGGCAPSPRSLARQYLGDLQQFNYPACYAMLSQRDRAARTLRQFLTEIPLAPDVDPIWFRAILFDTRYEIGEPKVSGTRAVVPVKVAMPDLTLWERTIDATTPLHESLNAAADKSLQANAYPILKFNDAIVMVKENHLWRVLADFARRDVIVDRHREAVSIYHQGDYSKALAVYQSLIGQLGNDEFSGARGLRARYANETKTIRDVQAQMPASIAYAPKLVLSDVAVKMSEGRLPAIFGRINNAGDRSVDDVRLTVTYYGGRGPKRAAVYRESHSIIVTPIEFTGFTRTVLPFVPGEARDFGFELVAPPQIQQTSEPSITVGLIVFTQSKAPLPKVLMPAAQSGGPGGSASAPVPSSAGAPADGGGSNPQRSTQKPP
jgi:hypothetical protein